MLLKVAVFGVTMSIMVTLLVSVMFIQTSDYDYDDITAYRNELISFSGESMLNENPWILEAVYTPWTVDLDASTHTTADGWLYGNSIDDYEYLNQAANVKLDPAQKSTVPINYSTAVASYTEVTGRDWWGNVPIISDIGEFFGFDANQYSTVTANNWQYTGYRYVFDPTLPFSNEKSVVDGKLNLVWYTYNGQEGLSGGLDVYGGSILLASYSATDIIADYNQSSGYATTYEFDFNGAVLTLSVKFDQNAIESGVPLMQAWTTGLWSMAISSTSAGNFLDITNSNAYSVTMGNVVNTFIQIYTFNMPSIGNEWMDMILWLMVGLPMTIAALCVALRLLSSIPTVI